MEKLPTPKTASTLSAPTGNSSWLLDKMTEPPRKRLRGKQPPPPGDPLGPPQIPTDTFESSLDKMTHGGTLGFKASASSSGSPNLGAHSGYVDSTWSRNRPSKYTHQSLTDHTGGGFGYPGRRSGTTSRQSNTTRGTGHHLANPRAPPPGQPGHPLAPPLPPPHHR